MNARTLPFLLLPLVAHGCFRSRPAEGGGETKASSRTPPNAPPGEAVARAPNAADVVLPPGYVMEVVARDLTYPTGIAFDDDGGAYVVESGYSYGEDFTTPRLLALEGGGVREIAKGTNGPWNGVAFHHGDLFVSEGGEREGGRILRISKTGAVRAIVEGLPSQGDHHTNGPVIGKDGFVYFAQGTVTNSGVVGEDSAAYGWLKRNPDVHDMPCRWLPSARRGRRRGLSEYEATPEGSDQSQGPRNSSGGHAQVRGAGPRRSGPPGSRRLRRGASTATLIRPGLRPRRLGERERYGSTEQNLPS